MDDDFFPYYCLEYRGLSFSEVHSKWGANAVNKIHTVLSNGIAKNFRKYCVDYANRQRSRAILAQFQGDSVCGTDNTSLSGNDALPLVFEPGVPP